MAASVRLIGDTAGIFAAMPAALRQARFAVLAEGDALPACLLINLAPPAPHAIAAAEAFAATPPPAGEDRLIVNVWMEAALADWPASRYAAEMAAFTRHAALLWAPARVRVNALCLRSPTGAGGPGDAAFPVAATIGGIWRWRSMTGQVIDLGG